MSEAHKLNGNAVCDRHGPYAYSAYAVGGHVIGKVCPTCLREGQEKAVRSIKEDEIQSKISERATRLAQAGVPPLFLSASFSNYVAVNASAKKNCAIISSYGEAFDHILAMKLTKGMVLTGVSGTGKTHLACALIDLIIDSGYSAVYASTPTLLWKLRDASMGRYETSLSHLLGKYSSPHLLILDEYGINTTTDKDYQLLFSLIDARYQKNLPTILITNVTQENLELELDDRFLERVRGANGPVLGFEWSSFRGIAK